MRTNSKNNIVILCVTLGTFLALVAATVALTFIFQAPRTIALFKGKYGFVDTSGKLIIPAQYDEVNNFSCGLARVKKGSAWQFIDRTGRTVLMADDRTSDFCDDLAGQLIFEPHRLYRYFNKQGKVAAEILDAKSAGWFSKGYAPIEFFEGRKAIVIDRAGRTVAQLAYDACGSSFKEGLLNVWKDQKEGFVDIKGNWTIPPQFRDANGFVDGVAPVVPQGTEKWGAIDKSGNLIIPPKYDMSAKTGFNLDDSEYSPYVESSVPYDKRSALGAFSEGLAPEKSSEKWGYINKRGAIVIPEKFDYAFPFSEGLALVAIGTKYGYIEHSGSLVIAPRFQYGYLFHEGLASVVTEDGKCGYIDKKGAFVIPPQFANAKSFSEGMAAVGIGEYSTK
jgi:WG containing repeat